MAKEKNISIQSLGGSARWKNVDKSDRSKIMKNVRLARESKKNLKK